MGTRADFYIKKAEEKELIWLASIAWDGFPDDIDDVIDATTQQDYIGRLQKFLSNRDDVTLPERGWPWPWDNSNTTDFAYCFHQDKVLTNHFGGGWHVFKAGQNNDEAPLVWEHEFPDMSNIKNVRMDKGSGIILISVKP